MRVIVCFFFQAEDGIRDAQDSRGLGDVYKRQVQTAIYPPVSVVCLWHRRQAAAGGYPPHIRLHKLCLLYTSDAADDLPCVDLGGRRITKKKNNKTPHTLDPSAHPKHLHIISFLCL